jgi:hypothetical protein
MLPFLYCTPEPVLTGIDQPFKERGESRLVPSAMLNWRLGDFFNLIDSLQVLKLLEKIYLQSADLLM